MSTLLIWVLYIFKIISSMGVCILDDFQTRQIILSFWIQFSGLLI